MDKNTSTIEIGKVSVQQKTMRGWLVGQFFPDGSSFKDDNVEIYCKTFKTGVTPDKLHKHPKGKEYMVVIKGHMVFRIGDEIFELKDGDYIAVPEGSPEKIIEVKTELTILGVRYPSIPENKVLLE